MRRFFVSGMLSVLLLIACSTEEEITFEHLAIVENNCEQCPKIMIDIPTAQPIERPEAQKINKTLSDFSISILNYTDENLPDSIPAAVEEFNDQYKELKEKFPESIMPWEATIKGEVSHNNSKIISFVFDSYIYTGGAHGYGSTSFLNFDLQTGEELEAEALFKDLKEFTDFVEVIFREQNDLQPSDNINSSGFMFEGDVFHLPASVGFDQKGIVLIYNPYEIASYADGQTEIRIPLEKAEPYILPKWLNTDSSS